jgi:hypothetical protein
LASPISIIKTEKEKWFKISNYDEMRPFFMNVVSDSNHWMFISSNGGLSAGRKNAEYALFPYYTDDKITDMAETTGSKTIFKVEVKGNTSIWEPFSERQAGLYQISRNLFKNWYGNKIRFEEVNHDLGLTFSYEWNSSNLYGFVKKSELKNHSGKNCQISALDGIQNVLPYGVESAMQQSSSNLADAYKRTELVKETGLCIFALSAIIVDKAEPSEALKANIAWSSGLENPRYLLSSLQLDTFRENKPVEQEIDVKGEKGAYFILSDFELGAEASKEWNIVANVNQNHAQVAEINHSIKNDEQLSNDLERDIDHGTHKLLKLTAASDGLQVSSDQLKNARHYSNVLFNIMRGGIFDDNYQIEKNDFAAYLKNASIDVFNRNNSLLDSLGNIFDNSELYELLDNVDDPDFVRLAKEYLPLKFSRRHGDPSRPWNRFSINTHSEVDGSKILDYEGNWRDIFQNWEALAYSYPGFIEGMIFKFLNASTFDGYNPYRVTKGGFDWEVIEPDDPWSYIGYWGDHQIIYLLKFLEFYDELKPGGLADLFDNECFAYANVPYRIKSYQDILKDPKNTIDFDEESDSKIRAQIEEKGADGALLTDASDDIHRVNFMEKILATVLSKLSNFIPEAGIWMNTQRPEWNDANNALVGNGVSMVTLCYLRRFLAFFEPILSSQKTTELSLSEELYTFFDEIYSALKEHHGHLNGTISDKNRKAITDALGEAGSRFRNHVYENGFSGKKSALDISTISDFVNLANSYAEHSIQANRREDDLYHSYNLMSVNNGGISISRLEEMLEGQVAVLSSGMLKSEEAKALLDSLRNSALYREDQNSYILYPNKQLPGFLERNNIPEKSVKESRLLSQLLNDNNKRIINRDVTGEYHFHGDFRNSGELKKALDQLKTTKYKSLVEEEYQQILQVFENVFNHKAFTGRSGTFFAYEGLGSIYWHMVSKLHLAVEEVCLDAHRKNAGEKTMASLHTHFREIGEGIGVHKSPELYGAFPTDPYSHTPFHRGAQQPGMTGQVKEDILTRIGELGVFINDEKLTFTPVLLSKSELLQKQVEFSYIPVDGEKTNLSIPENSLAFTFCQVPIIYKLSDDEKLEVFFKEGSSREFENFELDKDTSRKVFERTGEIEYISVQLSGKRFDQF